MKNIISSLAVALVFCSTAYAQGSTTALSTGYFTDGYIYKNKLNPALTPNMGYVSMPFLNIGLNTQSTLAPKDLFYPENGVLKTFVSPATAAKSAALMSNIKPLNNLNFNMDMNFLSVGFFNLKGDLFTSIDISSRTGLNSNVPYDFFAFAKGTNPSGAYNLSGLQANVSENILFSISQSYKFLKIFRAGYRLKFLFGFANVNLNMEKFNATLTSEKWVIDARGTIKSNPVYFGTKDNKAGEKILDLSKFSVKNPSEIINNGFNNFGFAGDIGFSVEPLSWIHASVSLTDIGFVNYKNCATGISDHSDRAAIVYPSGEQSKIGTQMKDIFDKIGTLAEFKPSESQSIKEMLPMQLRIAGQARLPMHDKLSFGLLYTQQFHPYLKWFEMRGSVNYDVARIFSVSVSYANGTFGSQLGALLNFHVKGFNLFLGTDNIPLQWGTMNNGSIPVPVSSLTTAVNFGINFHFGQYYGRYPKHTEANSES